MDQTTSKLWLRARCLSWNHGRSFGERVSRHFHSLQELNFICAIKKSNNKVRSASRRESEAYDIDYEYIH
jgi:hypothetical protein